MHTEDHNNLKAYGRQLLARMGFHPEEIFEEYSVKTGEARNRLIVDLVAISPNLKVAVECGHTEAKKLSQLDLFFDEVILLPYLKTRVSDYLFKDINFAQELRVKEDENAQLRKRIEELTEDKEKLTQELAGKNREIIQAEDDTARDFVFPFVCALYIANPKLAWSMSSEFDSVEVRQLLNTLRESLITVDWNWVQVSGGQYVRKTGHRTSQKDVIISSLVKLMRQKGQK